MGPRRILVAIVGTVQSMIGVLTIIFASILYIDLFGLQAWLNVTAEFLPLHMLVLLVFGFFSILSGLLLVCEEDSGS